MDSMSHVHPTTKNWVQNPNDRAYIYLDVLGNEDRALAKLLEPKSQTLHYQAPDALIQFLRAL